MKELDFDELDRAVNSLMTNAPKTPPSPKKDTEQTLTITPTIKSDDTPSLETLDTKMSQITGQSLQKSEESEVSSATDAVKTPSPITESTVPAVRAASPSVAARRGRFMDMVRPGAQAAVAATPAPVSRQGATIEPSRPIVNDIIPASTSASKLDAVLPAKTEEPIVPQIHTDVEPDTSGSGSEWPDPLDMADSSKKDVSASSVASKSSSIFGDEPLSSPFLPDTRVEKRPLGGVQQTATDTVAELPASTAEDVEAPEESQDLVKKDDTELKDASKQLPADPVKVADDAPLPEELSGDVIALESDANTIAMPVSSEKKAVIADQLDALKSDEGTKSDVDTVIPGKTPSTGLDNKDSGEPAVQPIVPTGPISIPQQYREEPSTGDKESGAIYDTDTYHQPLAHPKKKKSGWMWVIWIVVFLVIGAAGGAALFFLGVF